MTHCNIFNYKGVSESREVARGPKDPHPGVIGLKLNIEDLSIKVEDKESRLNEVRISI